MNCSFLLFRFLSGCERIEARSEMKKTPVACTEDVTHMKIAEICVRLHGGGSLEHKARVLCFFPTVSWNPQHTPGKVLYSTKAKELSLGEVALLPKTPFLQILTQRRRLSAQGSTWRWTGGYHLRREQGKTSQDEPTLGFPLDSCSW